MSLQCHKVPPAHRKAQIVLAPTLRLRSDAKKWRFEGFGGFLLVEGEGLFLAVRFAGRVLRGGSRADLARWSSSCQTPRGPLNGLGGGIPQVVAPEEPLGPGVHWAL